MIAFGADQNFDMNYARAVWRLNPNIVIVHASTAGVSSAIDEKILEWAAESGLVLLTHDRRTMPNYAYERVGRGLPMLGVVVVRKNQSMGHAARDIIKLIDSASPGELAGRVIHLPLKSGL